MPENNIIITEHMYDAMGKIAFLQFFHLKKTKYFISAWIFYCALFPTYKVIYEKKFTEFSYIKILKIEGNYLYCGEYMWTVRGIICMVPANLWI